MSDKSPASRFPRTGMDPIRDRRAGANHQDNRLAGPGVEWKDGQYRVKLARKSPLRLNREGEIVFEFDPETMELVLGSPYRVRARATPASVAAVQAENARLAAENASLMAANAALVLRVEALEATGVTLDARVAALEVG